MMSWHARAFLRLALRQPPEGIAAAAEWAAWRCPGTSAACRSRFSPTEGRIFTLAHVSACGETTRRHNAYAAAARDVLRALPGQPQLRVEVDGLPDADSRMDVVVTGAVTPAAGEPGGPPDSRTLLVDFSITEPMGIEMLARESHCTAGAAAAVRRKEKETRYLRLLDSERQRLLPWTLETWGRHDEALVGFLRGAARIAAEMQERPSTSSDDAEKRRVARVQASIFSTWMQRLSAGLAVAVAVHFDARFRPVGGTVARQAYRRFVPQEMAGSCALDEGFIGVSGRARRMEPRFAFAMACC